uniref:Iron complex transport system permease protein n=1 Tax=Candidatus Kentrum sp. FW TaxID=2126338 RepID=A0A450RT37_9GAMM|nr:MAG: iron complex transport system permease protein [Candidatus Kentron sp. FW]
MPALIDPRHLLWWLLTIALLAGAWGSLLIGYVDLPVTELLRGALIEGDATLARIVFDIRLPRVLLAILVGGSLGIAGATLQGLLRNPLAEPGLLGASGGAALGAVLALYTGLADQFPLALPLAGFTGTAVAVVLVYLLAGTRTGTTALILAGVAISALTSALIALVLNFSPNPHAALEIIFWTLGSLTDRSNQEFFLILPPAAIGMFLMLTSGTGLRALSLGEETAWSLGVNLTRLKVRVLVGCALAVGASVSVAGSIGFIGLVAPHLMRPLVSADPARLLPASALCGAILLLLADIGVRALYTQGAELKLGVLTALVGAPFFIFLILKTRRTMP